MPLKSLYLLRIVFPYPCQKIFVKVSTYTWVPMTLFEHVSFSLRRVFFFCQWKMAEFPQRSSAQPAERFPPLSTMRTQSISALKCLSTQWQYGTEGFKGCPHHASGGLILSRSPTKKSSSPRNEFVSEFFSLAIIFISSTRGQLNLGGKCGHFWGNMSSNFWGNMFRNFWGNMLRNFLGNMLRNFWGNMLRNFWGNMLRNFWGNMLRNFWGNMLKNLGEIWEFLGEYVAEFGGFWGNMLMNLGIFVGICGGIWEFLGAFLYRGISSVLYERA